MANKNYYFRESTSLTMKYTSFKINNYRAISDEIEININKHSLIPIIGVNECGKTQKTPRVFNFTDLI